MKIAYTGLGLPQGKMKYHDDVFISLVEKYQPDKVSPYYFEFLQDDYESADAIAMAEEKILDLLILDMEKIETRLSRTKDPSEKKLFEKCMVQVEDQKPVCDLSLNNIEKAMVKALKLISYTPTIIYRDTAQDPNIVCRDALEKAGYMFFYTVGKQEVHAWLVEKFTNAVSCAGKIHSDLARGFIKAELLSYEDLMSVHNMQEARTKHLTKLVDRDYVVPMNSILDIRFNV